MYVSIVHFSSAAPSNILSVHPFPPVCQSEDGSYNIPKDHDNIIMSCVGRGNPRPDIRWVANEPELSGIISSEYRQSGPSNTGTRTAYLRLTSSLPREARVTCIASNYLQEENFTVTLKPNSWCPSDPPTTTAGPTIEPFEVFIQIRLLTSNCSLWVCNIFETYLVLYTHIYIYIL